MLLFNEIFPEKIGILKLMICHISKGFRNSVCRANLPTALGNVHRAD